MAAVAQDETADIVVIGGGILGICTAYWLSSIFDARIKVLDASGEPAEHQTYRNTGIVHRPFYLDPSKKKTYALSSQLSRPLWEELAKTWALPWRPIGTLNVALTPEEEGTIEEYQRWGIENGMAEGELELMPGSRVRELEPEVNCLSALASKEDVSVDFRAFALQLFSLALRRGVEFQGNSRVLSLEEGDGAVMLSTTPRGIRRTRCKLLVNAAGGGALSVAHSAGVGLGLSQLNFRGEYWRVDRDFASKVTSNVYRPPRHPQFPFLDPHFVVRADGRREIGPNAVLVSGPYVYQGFGISEAGSFLTRPAGPRLSLLADRTFLNMVAGEWRSSISKSAMCGRVRRFIPRLDKAMLRGRSVFGVRSSLIDSGGFVPEALVLLGSSSVHVLNYNSPGATGAPSFAAMVVERIISHGLADGIPKRAVPAVNGSWSYDVALGRS